VHILQPSDFRYRTRLTTLHGERVMIVETDIPDDAPADIK
jgi:hypothetical protein